jgi:hypothetical protein
VSGFDYRKVMPALWTGKTGRWLRAQPAHVPLVAIYLCTCPSSTQWGVFYLPVVLICNDTGRSRAEVEGALEGLQGHGFAKFESTAEVVWVVNMCRDQVGVLKAKDNRVKAAADAAADILKMPFGIEWYEHYRRALQLPPMALDSPFEAPPKGEAPSEALRSQKQDQEQEQEQKQKQTPALGSADAQPLLIPTTPTSRFDFAAVYARYPRKLGKREGMASCEKLIRTPGDFEALAHGVDAFVAQVRKLRTPEDKIPYWSTFVNERRWEDFADVQVEAARKSLEEIMTDQDRAAGRIP